MFNFVIPVYRKKTVQFFLITYVKMVKQKGCIYR